jgi:hypothetical protein
VTALWLLALPISWTLAALVARGIVTVLRDLERSHRLDIDEERWTEDERRRREAGRMAGMNRDPRGFTRGETSPDDGQVRRIVDEWATYWLTGPAPTVWLRRIEETISHVGMREIATDLRTRIEGGIQGAKVISVEASDGLATIASWGSRRRPDDVPDVLTVRFDPARRTMVLSGRLAGASFGEEPADDRMGNGSMATHGPTDVEHGDDCLSARCTCGAFEAYLVGRREADALISALLLAWTGSAKYARCSRSCDLPIHHYGPCLTQPLPSPAALTHAADLLVGHEDLRAIRTAALALSRAVDAADLPPAGRMALLALRVALGPESVVVEEEG